MTQSRSLNEWRRFLASDEPVRTWRSATWKTRLWWIRQDVRQYLVDPLQQALANVTIYGASVESAHGINRMRQVFDQWWLSAKLDISPQSYYDYQLYLPERRKNALHHVSKFWELQLALIGRTSPSEVEICDDKEQFASYCAAHDIPTIPVIGTLDKTYSQSPISRVLDEPKCHIFIKPKRGFQGNGAELYTYDEGAYVDNRGKSRSWQQLLVDSSEKLADGEVLLLQPAHLNHSSWRLFTSGSLSTIRVITARLPEGGIEILSALLRMPIGNQATDNWCTGGMISSVDIDTGLLGAGYTRARGFASPGSTRHPDTDYLFKGTKLPHWQEIMQAARDAHRHFKMIFVGWDIALTQSGIRFVEANKCWDPLSLVISDGYPLQRSRFAALYDHYMQKSLSETRISYHNEPTNMHTDAQLP